MINSDQGLGQDLIERDLNDRINQCDLRMLNHLKMARNGNHYNQFFSVSSTVLSALLALMMTIFGTSDFEKNTVVITGASLSFFSLIIQKIHVSYNFPLLMNLHFNSADNFLALKTDFESIKKHLLNNNYNDHFFESSVLRYNYTCDKSHLQSIPTCPFFCCCHCFGFKLYLSQALKPPLAVFAR